MLNKRASVLLFALLLLAGVSAASLSVSKNAIDELVAARNLSLATKAFYSAETGLEQGLYLLRKTTKIVGDFPTTGSVTMGEEAGTWNRPTPITNKIQSLTKDELLKDQTWQIDLYNPDNLSSDFLPAQRLAVSWGSGDGWLEVSWVGWSNGEWTPITIKKINPARSTGTDIDLSQADNEGATLFRVRFRALFDNISNLEVASRDEKLLLSDIVIKSVGQFGQVQQAVEARLPRESPLSGLYDFVIFSEDSIIKELTP